MYIINVRTGPQSFRDSDGYHMYQKSVTYLAKKTFMKKEKKNTLEYYTEDQNNELDLHVVTWTDVKTKIWSEKSQCKSENISTQSFQKAWQLRNKNSFLHRESSCCLPFLSYFFPGK